MKTTVKELRLILTVDNLDELIRFYRDTVGLETSKEWHEDAGNGIILDAGRASLELIDSKHAERIDTIEVGKRVAGSAGFTCSRAHCNCNRDLDRRWRYVGGSAHIRTLERSVAGSSPRWHANHVVYYVDAG